MCRALLLELGCLIAKKNHETREMHIYIYINTTMSKYSHVYKNEIVVQIKRKWIANLGFKPVLVK